MFAIYHGDELFESAFNTYFIGTDKAYLEHTCCQVLAHRVPEFYKKPLKVKQINPITLYNVTGE